MHGCVVFVVPGNLNLWFWEFAYLRNCQVLISRLCGQLCCLRGVFLGFGIAVRSVFVVFTDLMVVVILAGIGPLCRSFSQELVGAACVSDFFGFLVCLVLRFGRVYLLHDLVCLLGFTENSCLGLLAMRGVLGWPLVASAGGGFGRRGLSLFGSCSFVVGLWRVVCTLVCGCADCYNAVFVCYAVKTCIVTVFGLYVWNGFCC
eukprot:gene3174-2156_t